MDSSHSHTAKANLSRLSIAKSESKPNAYTGRVNASRLSTVNAGAFVRNASILSRLGGEAVLSSMVRYFYGKALGDVRITRLFDAPDAATIERQIQQQITFLSLALGGSGDAEVQATYAALADKGITAEQFGGVVECVMATLRSQNVPPTVIDEIEAFCASIRPSIVR